MPVTPFNSLVSISLEMCYLDSARVVGNPSINKTNGQSACHLWLSEIDDIHKWWTVFDPTLRPVN